MTATIVPNHSQASRISFDLRADQPKPWHGNSYRMEVLAHADGTEILYIHWNTVICSVSDGHVNLFNARYFSSTTRGFQSRILSGMTRSGMIPTEELGLIRAELRKPTGERGAFRPVDLVAAKAGA